VLQSTGVSLLLVEQYVTRALTIADEVVLLKRGVVEFCVPPADLDLDAVLRGYLEVPGPAAPANHTGDVAARDKKL
jgi:branched-chain amino acid transport system ATP-binding protein